jgi:hypothetical protein
VSDDKRIDLRSLREAQECDGTIVLWGLGYPYVVCPARRVRCSEEALSSLLNDLDVNTSTGDEYSQLSYEQESVENGGNAFVEGMVQLDGAWIDKDLYDSGFAHAIRDVLDGTRDRLGYYGP